jgi:hypothetical protein
MVMAIPAPPRTVPDCQSSCQTSVSACVLSQTSHKALSSSLSSLLHPSFCLSLFSGRCDPPAGIIATPERPYRLSIIFPRRRISNLEFLYNAPYTRPTPATCHFSSTMTASNGYAALVANLSPQGRWRRIMMLAALPMVCAFLYYAYSSSLIHEGTFKPSQYPYQHNVSLPADDISMATVVKALYGPILHPVDAANFTDEDGDVYKLQGEPRFKQKLGKKVLILDIDSRPLTGDGQLMNEELKWKGMRPLSAGMLSHYMFGMRARLTS